MTPESKRICGFCMTRHHENCKPKITYYDKVWICECECREEPNEITEESNSSNETGIEV